MSAPLPRPRERPRALPVVILALGALIALKAANLVIGFATGAAEESVTQPDLIEAAIPIALAAPESDAERRLLAQLGERRAELARREAALDTREGLLAATEERIAGRLAALSAEEQRLSALRIEQQKRQATQFEALSSAYEKMNPRDAARIFDALGDDMLAPIAAGMRTQSLSGVLAEMNPERARLLTRLLAERNGAVAATVAP